MTINPIQSTLQSLLTPESYPSAAATTTTGDEVAVYQAVDYALDLTQENRDIFGLMAGLTREQSATFLDTLSTLLQNGVVGTELLEMGGKPYQTFADSNFADPALDTATRAYPYPGRNLDIYA